MFPFALVGRKFYHRASDGIELADHPNETAEDSNIQEVLTVSKNGKKALVTVTRLPDETDGDDPIEDDSPKTRKREPNDNVVIAVDSPEKQEVSYTTNL